MRIQYKIRLIGIIMMIVLSTVGFAQGQINRPSKKVQPQNSAKIKRKPTTGTINGYEWIDLGLPSGVKWATCNIGASSPYDYGDYFAWGEIAVKPECTIDNSQTRKRDIGNISGNPIYDAARACWGGTWRLPTKIEMQELCYKCTWKWINHDGYSGYKVIGPNGNSIFLPTAGKRFMSSLLDIGNGFYWTDTSHEDNAYAFYLIIGKDIHRVVWNPRYDGVSIRPVSFVQGEISSQQQTTNSTDNSTKSKQKPTLVDNGPDGFINYHGYVDLGLPSGLKWATCNIGASSPSDYGDYYAWGETMIKSEYTRENSKTNAMKIDDISGSLQYDAARANWGGTWRLPTKADFEELRDKCRWVWTMQNGHNGYKIIGPNGKYIFLPAAGYRFESMLKKIESHGFYRSSTPLPSQNDYIMSSYYLYFENNSCSVPQSGDRASGESIRPVSK